MKLEKLKLSNLKPAPWRITDDRPCPETSNVVTSLKKYGQLRPILVRPLGGEDYQIIDGHVVVDAAKKVPALGEQLFCVIRDLDEQQAILTYLHLKLNRTVKNHIKIRHAFERLRELNDGKTQQCLEELRQAIAWPKQRIEAYLKLSEQDLRWIQHGHYFPSEDRSTAKFKL
jgi:ParB-like chromosome segregation protein Spo0J